jgi:hypothetical protein
LNTQALGAELVRRSTPQDVLVVRVRDVEGAGSWRARGQLGEGGYRLEGAARVAGALGSGYAGLRVSGGRVELKEVGGGAWVHLEHTFECEGLVTEVDLVADAVGSQSEVEFDLASLRLVRIRPGNPEVDR